jgi:hypothetical protein
LLRQRANAGGGGLLALAILLERARSAPQIFVEIAEQAPAAGHGKLSWLPAGALAQHTGRPQTARHRRDRGQVAARFREAGLDAMPDYLDQRNENPKPLVDR